MNSRVPADVPEGIRPWAEQLRALASAANMRSQRQLAEALHVSAAAMSRYLSAERLPDRSTVGTLVALVREGGHVVDDSAVFGAYDKAEKAFADRRRRNDAPAKGDGDTGAVSRDRGRILVRAGMTVLIAVALGFGVAGFSGAFRSDSGQAVTPKSEVKCVVDACMGRNHNNQGCNEDARSLDSEDNGANAIVELMYSHSCQAAWARAKGAPSGSIIEITDADGFEQHAREKSSTGETPRPTLMLPAPAGARFTACITTGQQPLCTKQVTVSAE